MNVSSLGRNFWSLQVTSKCSRSICALRLCHLMMLMFSGEWLHWLKRTVFGSRKVHVTWNVLRSSSNRFAQATKRISFKLRSIAERGRFHEKSNNLQQGVCWFRVSNIVIALVNLVVSRPRKRPPTNIGNPQEPL